MEYKGGERRKMRSDHDMIQQLWYAWVGSNGDGGAERLRRVEEKLDKHLEWSAAFIPTVWTRENHLAFLHNLEEDRDSAFMRSIEEQRHKDNKKLTVWAIVATFALVAWPVALGFIKTLLK